MSRKPYPSDLTDAQWQLLEPLLPAAKPGGRPRKTDLRAVLDALFYLNREGCSWRALPPDFPPYGTVSDHLAARKADGNLAAVNGPLHRKLRLAAARPHTAPAANLDSQEQKAT